MGTQVTSMATASFCRFKDMPTPRRSRSWYLSSSSLTREERGQPPVPRLAAGLGLAQGVEGSWGKQPSQEDTRKGGLREQQTVFLGSPPDDGVVRTAEKEAHRHHPQVVFHVLQRERGQGQGTLYPNHTVRLARASYRGTQSAHGFLVAIPESSMKQRLPRGVINPEGTEQLCVVCRKLS